MRDVDWENVELADLAKMIRSQRSGPDAERTIWAFERALSVAQLDPDLLDYLLVAFVCLRARAEDTSPREVLDTFFRRSVPTDEWFRRYRPLLA